ncbi:MAG: phosphatidate cytidylyltransferase [Bacteroidales bacterium]|nr:phosphatidate cytidylyltransferase [Bacteroidales bacterium]
MKELPKRILSGIVILVLTAAGVLINRYLYVAFMAAVTVLCTIEYYRMAVDRRLVKEMICIILAEVTALSFFLIESLTPLLVAAVLVALSLVLLIVDSTRKPDFNVHLFFPLLYILMPVLISFAMIDGPSGAYTWAFIVPVISITWVADIGAYATGSAFGQRPDSRKLCPALSPKKSWAGVGGAVLFALVFALIGWLVYNWMGIQVMTIPGWLGLALVLSVAGVFGDLFESLIKRHFGVKDSSNFIPGHGGVLDRFDDLFFAFPAAALYLACLGVLA